MVVILLVLVSVFFFVGLPASAASGKARTELESQPEEDEEEGAPWAVVIVGIMLGVVSFLLAWFLFNPLPSKGISKRARGAVTLYECWVTPSEPVVGKETELKVVLENTGPSHPPGEHDVGVTIYDESDVIEAVKAGSFSLEPGRKTELLVTWVPEMSGVRKITIIITQGGVEVDEYGFSKMVEEEQES